MADVYGLEIEDLRENLIPVEAIVIVKCMDKDKDSGMVLDIRCTEGLYMWDVIGMLRAYAAEAESHFVDL